MDHRLRGVEYELGLVEKVVVFGDFNGHVGEKVVELE
jgi:hypothetical protein